MASKRPLHVSLVAIPDAFMSTLAGIYDVLNGVGTLTEGGNAAADRRPIHVEIVGEESRPVTLVSGLRMDTHQGFDAIEATDLVIVPSLMVGKDGWTKRRYPALVGWLKDMHARGATLCSACSGLFLLAETGLFDGRDATVHWNYASAFRKAFPDVPLYPERVLIATGEREQYVSSGAAASWHDLVLYLISRHVGVVAARAVAKFYALRWHDDGLAPYIVFSAPTDHGDAVVEEAQRWLASHFSVAAPVEEMVKRSGLPERTFKRRFTKATGHAPIAYVQRLRIEEAKRRLERTDAPIDEIAWRTGYEDPAFFRRLFKRFTSVTPGVYRRKYRIPEYISASR